LLPDRGLYSKVATLTKDEGGSAFAPPTPCYSALICGGVPMKGGYRLELPRDNGTYAGCTNGFNIKGSNHFRYTLTAGHCVLGGQHDDGLDYSSHNGIPVGYETWMTKGSYPKDYTLMPFQGDARKRFWLPSKATENQVRSICAPGNRPRRCSTKDFGITGFWNWEHIQLGWVVCGTGAGDKDTGGGTGATPGTRCGEITDKDSAGRWNGGLTTNTCARNGSSGGPLYNQVDNKAYGILSGGTPRSGPCPGVGVEVSTPDQSRGSREVLLPSACGANSGGPAAGDGSMTAVVPEVRASCTSTWVPLVVA
jgi:hypothetical protein